ncbi:hypothetical protein B0H11DRAFT_1802499 [Mycena galericulata]|nr:hypothetical protein B0H11DRAFT_1802499 [Mycena galericulata]
MDVDAEPKPTQRVEDLWFEDGNLVLEAGNSQFCVHRGILAARSPVFRDMLSFPQPSDSELIDGCPLVRLHDSAAHVTVFLKAIFEPEFFMPFPSRTTFDIIVGCLRLSHKYEVEYLRRRALVHLSSRYDTELSRSDRVMHGDKDPAASDMVSWPWTEDPISSIFIIQLIREVDALWLLPTAFYNLSSWFTELGTTIFRGAIYNGVPTSLSNEDQDAFAKGHTIQSQSATTDILRFLWNPLIIVGCSAPMECSLERLRAVDIAREIICDNISDPLAVWAPSEWELLEDLCPFCRTQLRTTQQAARQVFWDKLPGMYGLPPWEELEQMKIAAIGTNWIS